MKDLLSLTQAAKSLGVSRQRVHTLINEGRLPAVKVGPYWLIEAKALAAYRPLRPGRPTSMKMNQ